MLNYSHHFRQYCCCQSTSLSNKIREKLLGHVWCNLPEDANQWWWWWLIFIYGHGTITTFWFVLLSCLNFSVATLHVIFLTEKTCVILFAFKLDWSNRMDLYLVKSVLRTWWAQFTMMPLCCGNRSRWTSQPANMIRWIDSWCQKEPQQFRTCMIRRNARHCGCVADKSDFTWSVNKAITVQGAEKAIVWVFALKRTNVYSMLKSRVVHLPSGCAATE